MEALNFLFVMKKIQSLGSFQLGAVRNMLKIKDEKENGKFYGEKLQSIKSKEEINWYWGNIRSFLNSQGSKEMSLNEFIKKSGRLSKLDTKENNKI